MARIVVNSFLTLDGVMQAPGGSTEDREDGFQHGGWQAAVFDDEVGAAVGAGMGNFGGLLLGRKTYDIFAGYWPNVPDDSQDREISTLFNATPKYVATRTRTELDWANSTVLGPDVPAAIAELRERDGADIHVIGSGNLIQTLMKHDLVDEYALMFFPVVLGTGKRLFADGTVPTTMKLVESSITAGGTIIARYRPAGEVKYGSFGIDG
jgi:dihydrofolate reductase